MNRSENTTQDFDNISATRRSVMLASAAILAGLGSITANAATIDEIKKCGAMNIGPKSTYIRSSSLRMVNPMAST